MTEYDIVKILDEMELELIEAMKGHYSKGLQGTTKEWQKRQLQELQRFKKENEKIIKKYRKTIKGEIEAYIRQEYSKGQKQEKKFLIDNLEDVDIKLGESSKTLVAINDRKIMALMQSVTKDIDNAMYSAFRLCNDEYRKTIFKAATLMATGQYDLVSAIDTAQMDFLNKGISSVEYKNGTKMPVRSYAEMALRTNSHRAKIMGESDQAHEFGISTCYVSSHGITCDKCAMWQGQWLFDDVYNDNKPNKSNPYPLLSEAIAGGLFHPNCRHSLIYGEPDGERPKEIERTEKDREKYKMEQEQRAIEREIRKAKRVSAGAMSPEVKEKEAKLLKHLKENEYLVRKKWREHD